MSTTINTNPLSISTRDGDRIRSVDVFVDDEPPPTWEINARPSVAFVRVASVRLYIEPETVDAARALARCIVEACDALEAKA